MHECTCILNHMTHIIHNRSGLVSETALYSRIAECFIKHPTYFFGEAPSIDITPHPVKRSHSHTISVPPLKPLDTHPSEESTDNNSEIVEFDPVERRRSNTSEEGGENTDGKYVIYFLKCYHYITY